MHMRAYGYDCNLQCHVLVKAQDPISKSSWRREGVELVVLVVTCSCLEIMAPRRSRVGRTCRYM